VNQTSQLSFRVASGRWQKEDRKSKEDMARYAERSFEHNGCGLDWIDCARWRLIVAECSMWN